MTDHGDLTDRHGIVDPGTITDHLVAWGGGDQEALTPLMDAVYERLLRLASTYLKRERDNHTLDAAGLVNEAFLKLIQQERVRWQDRAHFFAVAAKVMRRILLDHARRHDSLKRGRDVLRIPLEDVGGGASSRHPDLIAVDEALWELESRDAELAELVVMRYFGGMKKEEVAEVLGISPATVSRRWRTARAWLFEYLKSDTP